MSSNRIMKRMAFRSSQPPAFANGIPRLTYHEYAVAAGHRHPSFQKNIRAARAAMGHRKTSTDMHHFEGKAF